MSKESGRTPWILWPFVAVWRLVALIIEITGVVVSLTVVGLVIGIPLILFGFLLVVRGFF